ncbi:hypothetical protein BC939DRAFT_474395 [Gamsiella multidivaricata]|uniref:uncharacterized protein n=1 Tax=Gamsiella multidivaricata TaxID=101098 RepID=UPI0022203333|nr:uncharacterized protein BC939DRAFT_474395 [Gamsiella multidivaricata]KAG0350857.1 hypothetical protein BGZ54_003611 [Gamsiella multidivaricata]KAI7829495.1 hypothetical protein BC939DRAFT_474395 [Gamsiella multidivaricata]
MPVAVSCKNDSTSIDDLLKTKGLISDGSRIEIDQGISAIENFVLLNQSSRSYRQTAPLTGTEQPFMLFSERELGILLLENAALKKKLQELVLVDYGNRDIIPSQQNLIDWLGQKASGFLITEMLLNVGRREPREGPRDYKDSTSVMGLSMMKEHVQSIRLTNFDLMTYEGRRYVH